jgi:alkaline phosphatase
MNFFRKNFWIITGFGIIFFGLVSCGQTAVGSSDENTFPKPKNIIFFIGDGMGYNHVLAANFYEFGQEKAQPFEQDDWTQVGLATYPAVTRKRDGEVVFSTGYSPRQAWSDAKYNMLDYTDSGAGGTALSTGRKTYNSSIGIGVDGDTLTHISQAAKAIGKSIGVVSSVQLSHATPASFAAHNSNRSNYEEIARYMFFNTRLDLIMAIGHPNYDDDGRPSENNDRYVGGHEIWSQLVV